MSARNARRLSVAALLGAGLQGIALARYLDRLPGDTIGIALDIVIILAFLLVTFGFYTQGRADPRP
jgi:hypothetical protein